MPTSLIDTVRTSLLAYDSTTRLYALALGSGGRDSSLLVEGFYGTDALFEPGYRDVIALSPIAHLDLDALLGEPAALKVTLADGGTTEFHGEVCEAADLGSNGGLARYRLRLTPWIWRLSQTRNSRVWQDKSVLDIVDAVFATYAPAALWRWSDESQPFLAGSVARSYCCQYRETDLDFIRRLLAEEGLSWRIEHGDDGAGVVLFADSTDLTGVPADDSSDADDGIRFHNARAGEHQDTIQALRSCRTLHASLSTVLSYDYKAKQIVAASVPTAGGGPRTPLPALESYDVPGQYAFADSEQAQRYATFHMQAMEARGECWNGRSTVRTLRAGTRITVRDAPLRQLAERADFVTVRVTSVGINNLPRPASEALAELFGPIPELLADCAGPALPDDFALAVRQAQKTGYANQFDAIDAALPWREWLPGAADQRPRPTARGAQSAIVVGADGSDQPQGADELYCDRLGRVRIRFHWQDQGDATCWVRAAQRSAGGGMGAQFLPRIGMEVLVQFLENDIDRPIIVGALYNGRGEGGIPPTPGGQDVAGEHGTGAPADYFGDAHDHAPSGQGNLAGGHSPVWHGASADSAGHRNGAAQWGIRSKEFGGAGYSQLLFDDTDAQGRVQLRCSHAASELNLGHLIHAADNYRGSFRGLGAELRTDAYGALRAGAGLLISSYKIAHDAAARDPAGDNGPGIAMLKQAVTTAQAMSGAAVTHQTVALAAHIGAQGANCSKINPDAAPLPAMLAALSGMVSSDALATARADAQAVNVRPGDDKVPHTAAGVIAIAAQAGLGVVAGQSVQLANGETVTLVSGRDTQFSSGGQLRIQTGQAIGVLGGAMKPGAGGAGLQLIAGNGAVDIQAQNDGLAVQGRDDINIISANAHIDWAAAQRISLSTAGGANITIDGGNITVQCPGKIVINAGTKNFNGPTRTTYDMPVMPNERNTWVELEASYADAWNTQWPLDYLQFDVAGATVAKATSVNPL